MGDRRVAIVADAGFYVGPALSRLLAERGHDLVLGDPSPELVVELSAVVDVEVVEGARDLAQEGAADRLVVTAGGIVHDMRCDGTEANGVNDVAEFDKATPITVVATYEDGVHVLRPVGLPIEVTRHREGDQLVWQYLGFTARLEQLGEEEGDG